jgi:hypothetical protein
MALVEGSPEGLNHFCKVRLNKVRLNKVRLS